MGLRVSLEDEEGEMRKRDSCFCQFGGCGNSIYPNFVLSKYSFMGDLPTLVCGSHSIKMVIYAT